MRYSTVGVQGRQTYTVDVERAIDSNACLWSSTWKLKDRNERRTLRTSARISIAAYTTARTVEEAEDVRVVVQITTIMILQ